jgi:hypothetical protein
MSFALQQLYKEAQCANTEGCNSYRLADPVLEPRQCQAIPSFLNVQTGTETHHATYPLYTGVHSSGKNSQGVTFNTKPYLSLMLIMNGVLHPFPPLLYAFIVYTWKTFPFNPSPHFQYHDM